MRAITMACEIKTDVFDAATWFSVHIFKSQDIVLIGLPSWLLNLTFSDISAQNNKRKRRNITSSLHRDDYAVTVQ